MVDAESQRDRPQSSLLVKRFPDVTLIEGTQSVAIGNFPLRLPANYRNQIELFNRASREEKTAISAAPRSPPGFQLARQ